MKSLLGGSGRISSVVAVCVMALSALSAKAALPPAAQSALDKGLIAARRQDWDIAIQNFKAAHDAAPAASEPLYNLGLAELKVPGRELLAAAWFGAYLADKPNAANAKQIHDEILELLVTSEEIEHKLLSTFEGILKTTSEPERDCQEKAYHSGDTREANFQRSRACVEDISQYRSRISILIRGYTWEADKDNADRIVDEFAYWFVGGDTEHNGVTHDVERAKKMMSDCYLFSTNNVPYRERFIRDTNDYLRNLDLTYALSRIDSEAQIGKKIGLYDRLISIRIADRRDLEILMDPRCVGRWTYTFEDPPSAAGPPCAGAGC